MGVTDIGTTIVPMNMPSLFFDEGIILARHPLSKNEKYIIEVTKARDEQYSEVGEILMKNAETLHGFYKEKEKTFVVGKRYKSRLGQTGTVYEVEEVYHVERPRSVGDGTQFLLLATYSDMKQRREIVSAEEIEYLEEV